MNFAIYLDSWFELSINRAELSHGLEFSANKTAFSTVICQHRLIN